MKDFDITAIVTEFTNHYHLDSRGKLFYNKPLVFSNNADEPFGIFIDEDFDYYSDEVQKVYDQIEQFARQIETYEGELDSWIDSEKRRIQKRVMLELYNKYMTA